MTIFSESIGADWILFWASILFLLGAVQLTFLAHAHKRKKNKQGYKKTKAKTKNNSPVPIASALLRDARRGVGVPVPLWPSAPLWPWP